MSGIFVRMAAPFDRRITSILRGMVLWIAAILSLTAHAQINHAPIFQGSGQPGTVVTDVSEASGISEASDWGYDLAIQADGKYLVTGTSADNGFTDFTLLRYNVDGTLDTDFGEGGKLRTALVPLHDSSYAVAVQPDGRIVLGGFAFLLANDFAVVRYNADGALDMSFYGGIVTTDFGSHFDQTYSWEQAYSMDVQANGKIVLAGRVSANSSVSGQFGLVRYNSDGSLDTSWGGDGKVITSAGYANGTILSVSVQPDGKILAAGYGTDANHQNSDPVILRYLSDGSLDASFDGDGILSIDFGGNDTVQSVLGLPNGKILAVGCCYGGGFLLMRLNSNGSLDSTFGSYGVASLPIQVPEYGRSIALQPDGKILVAGGVNVASQYAPTIEDLAVLRLNANGTLDTSFGVNGVASITVSSLFGRGNSVRVQSDGKIVVAGGRYKVNGTDSDFVIARFNADGTPDTTFGTPYLANQTAKSGELLSFTIPDGLFSDPDAGDSLTYSAMRDDGSSLPEWLVFDPLTLTFSGTPTLADIGSISLKIVATDQGGLSASSDPFIFTVTGVPGGGGNTPPTGSVNITGLPKQNETLLAEQAFDDADGVGYLSYRWQSSEDGMQWSSVPGAYSPQLTLIESLVGKRIRVVVSYYDGLNNWESVTSLPTDPVTNVNDAPIFRIPVPGAVTTDVGVYSDYYGDWGYDFVISPDGKYLVTGTSIVNGYTDFTLLRYNADGTLDTGFGEGGKLTTALGSYYDNSYAIALLPDGRIVLGGFSSQGASDYAVARYNPDGSLDTSFSGDGMVTTDIGYYWDQAYSMDVQADGKIVLGGMVSSSSSWISQFGLVRYSTDGSLDTSFGDNGKVVTSTGHTSEGLYSVSVQPDGKILAAGYSYNDDSSLNYPAVILRHLSDGSLDTSFDGDGILNIGNSVYSVLGLPDGKILAAGWYNSGPALMRLNDDGSLDSTFGSLGVASLPIPVFQYGRSIALQPDGKILVVGGISINGQYDLAVARLNANGTKDTSFGVNGVASIAVSPTTGRGHSVRAQSDGKIVVVGGQYKADGSDTDFVIARFNADGTPDATFKGSVLNDQAVNLGELLSFTVPDGLFVDPDTGDSLTYSAMQSDGSALPEWLVFDPSTLTFSGTPALADIGSFALKIVATDQGSLSASSSPFTITVTEGQGGGGNPPPDIVGPVITDVAFAGAVLSNGAVLSHNGLLSFTAADQSGVASIELLLDGVVVGAATGSGNYSAAVNLDSVSNGAYTLTLRASDSLGNVSNTSFNVTVAHAGPDVPVIDQPVSGTVTHTAVLTVSGQAKAGSSIQLLLNGQPQGSVLTVGSDGRFSGVIELISGANQIQATATDAHGASAPCAPVTVTLDTVAPSSPGILTAQSQGSGKVRLTWIKTSDPEVVGYHIYRSSAAFTSVEEAVKAGGVGAGVAVFEDLPPADGIWTYRVVAVNAVGVASLPSNAATVLADGTAPKALSIAYTSLGKVDSETGHYGQGQINLILTVSEALQTTPYLAIVPQGGIPIPIELIKTGDTTYTGGFLIDGGTPSGIANALFSARDAVGNQGTGIEWGATLPIDTEGPELSNIELDPATPIRNTGSPTLQATFTFSEAPAVPPQITYRLSGPVRAPELLSGLTAVDAVTYAASFVLPADAGLGGPEVLSFSQQAQDDLDNVSTKVSAFNHFQVYQGDLPPLPVPSGLTAKAQPGGKVLLAWQAVAEADSYEIYRQAPGQTELQVLTRVAGIDHIDQTPADGLYRYAIATVRQANEQESISVQSAAVEVQASATAPGAPQNLTLELTGQGIRASWQAPLASEVDYYNLYRAGGTTLSSLDGLTPFKTRIKTLQAIDTNPSPLESAYVVTAVDAAGNESALSNSEHLNASLLPVRNLHVERIGNGLPVLTWQAPNGSIAGYLVYVGPDDDRIQLTPTPITGTTLTDTGYTTGERRYTVAAVDANGDEMPRSVLLPAVSSQIAAGLPIKRGIMNKLQVQVTNTSETALDALRVVVRLPIDKDGTQYKDHPSGIITLSPNQTQLVPVIVGGYAELPGAPQAQVGVEIAPNEGELVKIAQPQIVEVIDGALVVGLATAEFTRGGVGKLKLTVENTSDVEVELLTATNNTLDASSELRFKLLDADDNILSVQAYQQVLGAGIVNLANGLTVARIPAGSAYVSDTFDLNVPGASPDSLRVRLEVDKLRYHSGQEDEIQIAGRGSERTVSLIDVAYVGEITDVSPLSSFGDEDIQIQGRSIDRNGQALPNTRLTLILNQQGFERRIDLVTDAAGEFLHTFQPTLTDAGLYKVSAVHPDITDRPEQKAFTINRVTVGPTPFKLDVPRNYPATLPFTARAGAGTVATHLRLVLDAGSQPTGQLPEGLGIQLPAPVTLQEKQTLNIPVLFTANNDAQSSGALVFDVISDEHSGSPIGRIRVNYTLTEAKPYLVGTPSFIETGLAQGGSQIEALTIKNNGFADALKLQFTLENPNGSPAPAWAAIGSQADGTLAMGASRVIDLVFTPPSGTPEGIYEFRLKVVGDNVPTQAVNVYVSLTQSGQGSVLFKASDIYTATIGKDGQLIQGLAGATVTVQNEEVQSITLDKVTNTLGEALFQNLPAGRYQFRVRASNHQEIGGRFTIKPGITLNQPVFLDYNLITVEWSVREITIEDRYEITLNATYETDVPAAVVMLQPSSVNLPKMAAGDVYYGELTLTNHGLIRAEHLRQQLPQSDAYFQYEFLVDLPSELEAKQRVTIPYRVIALQSLEEAAGDGNASGGGCHNYSNFYSVVGDYKCINGTITDCGSATRWYAVSNSTCPAGSGGGGGGGGGGAWGWVGGGLGGGSAPTTMPMRGQMCVFVPKGDPQCPSR
jgi:uncharacterized delta-60 repeat protein